MLIRISIAFMILAISAGIFFVVPWSGQSVAPVPTSHAHRFDTFPSDSGAIPAVQQTMRQLAEYSLSDQKILSGQNVGHMSEDLLGSHYRTWIRLTRFRNQPAPSVMGFDLGLNTIPRNPSPLIKLARPHADAGGLVTVSMHPRNPWTEGSYDDREHGDFEELFQQGNPVQERWRQTLDQAARILKALQREEIAVLWRPLHEANGYWFWWCGGGEGTPITPEQYRKLWHDMKEYFTEQHQLHNLIWVYSANAKTAPEVLSPMEFYPGDEAVDIVGLDYYGPDVAKLNQFGSYDEIVRSGKIIALTEFGARPMDGSLNTKNWSKSMQASYAHLSYFVFWHSWPKNLVALSDLDEVEGITQSGWVHNLGDEFKVEVTTLD